MELESLLFVEGKSKKIIRLSVEKIARAAILVKGVARLVYEDTLKIR